MTAPPTPTVQSQPSAAWFPSDEELRKQVGTRKKRGSVFRWIFLMALLVGVIPATAIVYLMWISAYRQTVGTAATS